MARRNAVSAVIERLPSTISLMRRGGTPIAPVAYAQAYFSLKEALEALFDRPVDLITPAALNNPYFRASLAASSERVYAA